MCDVLSLGFKVGVFSELSYICMTILTNLVKCLGYHNLLFDHVYYALLKIFDRVVLHT